MERTLLTAACEALPDSCDRRTSDNEPPTAEEDLVLPHPTRAHITITAHGPRNPYGSACRAPELQL